MNDELVLLLFVFGRACDLCGRILENFNFSTDVTFVKNAAGQVCILSSL